MYYTEEEMAAALVRAREKLDGLTALSTEYIRGENDCFAFFIAYDEELRGPSSVAKSLISFKWKSTREFLVKLIRSGFSIEEYAVACNYEIVLDKRPKLGDITFENGAMVNDGKFWVSTQENLKGTKQHRPVHFFERKASLGRPLRS